MRRHSGARGLLRRLVRSVIIVDVERISDSCGYGAALMRFNSHRPIIDAWAERKGRGGVRACCAEKNASSVEGLAGIPATAGR